MPLSVSSWFIAEMAAARMTPLRRFTINGSDYSGQVLRWPTIQARTRGVDLGTLALPLSNLRRDFQFLVSSGGAMTSSCDLSVGLTHPESGTEWLSLFEGQPSALRFSEAGGALQLTLQGKTRALALATLGNAQSSGALNYMGSNYLPADLAWQLLTVRGGLSAAQSAGNPDIDYESWSAWRSYDALRDLRVQGWYTGEKLLSSLENIGLMASRGVSFRAGKLRFDDVFAPYSSQLPALDGSLLLDLELLRDGTRIVNTFLAEAAFSVANQNFTSVSCARDAASVTEWGERIGRFSTRETWFETAADAGFLTEDRVRFESQPLLRLRALMPLAAGVHHRPGDVVTLPLSWFDVSSGAWRIEAQAVDLQDGTLRFDLVEATRRRWQHELAANEDLEFRVRTLTVVGSDTFLMVDDATTRPGIFRSGAGGVFEPIGTRATALLACAGGAFLLSGGAVSSASGAGRIRRSTDGGSSWTVVHCLPSPYDTVHDIFEVQSGTYLASVDSGQILRSTNAGSSWSLTATISPAYYVSKFWSPRSGTIWGASGTVLQNAVRTAISQNGGSSFVFGQLVDVNSGGGKVRGFHNLSETEFLVGIVGNGTPNTRVKRGEWLSVNSVGWTTVDETVAFSHMEELDDGTLVYGVENDAQSNDAGRVRMSTDQGSSWSEHSRVAKPTDVRLLLNGDGTLDAWISGGGLDRLDRFRNYTPTSAG